jgi:hypothetical protein
VYDLSCGGFSHVELTDRTGAESLLRCAPVAGEVLIADRGYAKAKELRACLAPSGSGARDFARDFIIRVGWKALALRDREGNPFNLIAQLEQLPQGDGLREWAVQAVTGSLPACAAAGSAASLLPIRLIAVPLPRDKAEANRVKLKRTASKHQNVLDPRSLLAAGFMVLVTSLPDAIPAAEIYAAYRLRWQACPCESEGRTGVQAAEIAAPHRPITDPHNGRQPELAVCPSDPASADRRHLPGFPGIFPLRALPMRLGARHGGLPSWRSTHCTVPSAASPCAPSSPLIRACTNSSLTRNESENDKCFLLASPYPDAYGDKPGHDV